MSKTRVLEAVRQLDLKTTRALLTANPGLREVTDRKGRNLLHLACSASWSDLNVPESAPVHMIKFLLDQGIDIESTAPDPTCEGMPPVFFAVARARNPTLVKLLLKRGAKPTGLFAAGWYEDIPMLDLLIKAGATIDEVVGVTPFLACWCWRKFGAAKFLAKKGANVDYQDPKNGKTALHYGLEKDFDPELLGWLVTHGASADVADHSGNTARQLASRKRDERYAAAFQTKIGRP